MGIANSEQKKAIDDFQDIINPENKNDIEVGIQKIVNMISGVENIGDFSIPDIKTDSLEKVKEIIMNLINFLHTRATKANFIYSQLKDSNELPQKCDEGIRERLFLLAKLLQTTFSQHSNYFSEFLWKITRIFLFL